MVLSVSIVCETLRFISRFYEQTSGLDFVCAPDTMYLVSFYDEKKCVSVPSLVQIVNYLFIHFESFKLGSILNKNFLDEMLCFLENLPAEE